MVEIRMHQVGGLFCEEWGVLPPPRWPILCAQNMSRKRVKKSMEILAIGAKCCQSVGSIEPFSIPRSENGHRERAKRGKEWLLAEATLIKGKYTAFF